jgi:tetratricopeptide (TPR) repeat protein
VTGRRAAVALAAVLCCPGAGRVASAKTKKQHHHHHHHEHRSRGHHGETGPAAEGKAHLKRATELADDDDCKAAVEEYKKAYELLDDPVVLFNRAECYRRLGDGERAADDYHAFLEKVPNAPNRAAIEAKIVALEAPEPAARESRGAREKSAEATAPPPAPKPAETPTAPLAPKQAEAPATPPPAAAPEQRLEPAVTLARPAVADDAGPARGTHPWVWVALAVLVAGAGVGGYVMLRPRPEAPPQSALGNYRF